MIKLCVFDVDGTLVTHGDRRILPSTLEALKQLKQKGVKLAIASGRPPFAMEKRLLDEVEFDYFICSNGACVLRQDGHVLYQFEFTLEESENMIQAIREYDDAMLFQCVEAAYCYHGYQRIASMMEGFLGRLDILVDRRSSMHYDIGHRPLAVVASIEEKNFMDMKERFPQFTFTPFGLHFYDINGPHSKATGIQHICEEMHCRMEEVAAFGDDYNDQAMIRTAGYGIAMGNAREEVKQDAFYVTKNCNDDGVMHACRHFGWI